MAEESRAFELTIEFAGMCLFVPDPAKKQMHVLMPHVHEHVPRLYFDRKYLHSDVDTPLTCEGVSTHYACEELSGTALDLTGIRSPHALSKRVTKDIVNLTRYLTSVGQPRTRVNKQLLQQQPPADRVSSRVSLGAGELGPHHRGARWSLKPWRPRFMAISGIWIIRNVEHPLVLTIQGEQRELVPQKGKVELHVFHAPNDEVPDSGDLFPEPMPGEPVNHFAAFYDLFDLKDGQVEVPEYPKKRRAPGKGSSTPIAVRGRRLTCIMAQAQAR